MNRLALALCALVASCATPEPPAPAGAAGPSSGPVAEAAPEPGWWADGRVCYEVFVRSFHDSDGDGVGDLEGLIGKLDHISDGDPATRGDLGAGCIWLMPVAQSPSYHGYDVTDYYHVERDYGTEEQFRRLVDEAHRRGIRVLVDLVLNHSSSEHVWFRDALLDPDSPFRDWYTWSPTERRMPGWEAPTWHPSPFRDEYYYGLFWGGMPDLNLANPEVRAEAERIARFWLEEMGVDGFRMDAVAHFFEEGGRWRHVEAVHPWLRDYQASLRRIEPEVFTVGEVWDSTGAILPYYPDQLDAYFIFEVADAIVDAARTGSKDGLVYAVARVERDLPRGRWASFLRNHDQTRTMTELEGDWRRARLAASLLLTLPGVPFVYYGEEIGMTASKSRGDPRLRTPMHWSVGPAAGFTTGTPWEPLRPDSSTANVEVQDGDPASLLNHYRRMIPLRTESPALGTGDFVPLETGDDAVAAWLRRAGGQVVAVVANLGDERRRDVALSSEEGVLRPGRWGATRLAGGDPAGEAGGAGPAGAGVEAAADPLHVDEGGRIRSWAPLPTLAPLEVYVLELSRDP